MKVRKTICVKSSNKLRRVVAYIAAGYNRVLLGWCLGSARGFAHVIHDRKLTGHHTNKDAPGRCLLSVLLAWLRTKVNQNAA